MTFTGTPLAGWGQRKTFLDARNLAFNVPTEVIAYQVGPTSQGAIVGFAYETVPAGFEEFIQTSIDLGGGYAQGSIVGLGVLNQVGAPLLWRQLDPSQWVRIRMTNISGGPLYVRVRLDVAEDTWEVRRMERRNA